MGIRKLFSDSYGQPLFSAVMSRNRFAFIRKHFSLMMKVLALQDGKRTGY